ncbi:type IV pilin [Haloarculaceae archaeon H-GB2-1]|nr:type IV pilin [Haloarculaceae archaeon H-GB1-1]MEA5407064.1 type IV pilin [Haloarculaceae archaeon H-GB2-1]
MASDTERRLRSADRRATTSVVGVVLLVGVTVTLAATVTTAGFALTTATHSTTPTVAVDPDPLDASDGWPDGQTIRLVHRSGPPVNVSRLTLVVSVPDGRSAHLTGFPTRRLTPEHVAGADLFDRSYAGIDGELDAAHTDGQWEAGEVLEVRLARGHVDVTPGDRVSVAVVDSETNVAMAEVTVVASE